MGYMRDLHSHPEPVLLTYRSNSHIHDLLRHESNCDPLITVTDEDDVRHMVWRVTDPAQLITAFATIPHLYIADGHHRSSAASRLASTGEAPSHFPAVLFPADELRILAYNRAISDLAGLTQEDFLQQLSNIGELTQAPDPIPKQSGYVTVRLPSGWYQLNLNYNTKFLRTQQDPTTPEATLFDTELLQQLVLGPILGVLDPRNDTRFIPIGGRDSIKKIERLVDNEDAAAGFSTLPPTVNQMLEVADIGNVMPLKSTWIDPKLQSGLFVQPFGNLE